MCVVAFTRDGLLVLDSKTGDVQFQERWRARIQTSVNAATPLVRGDEVFLSSSYSTGAVPLAVERAGPDGRLEGRRVAIVPLQLAGRARRLPLRD